MQPTMIRAETTFIMGLPISHMTPEHLLARFDHAINLYRQSDHPIEPTTVAYANAHSCNLFAKDPSYRRAMLASSLVYLDGNGPRVASWLAGDHFPPRMTAPDWFDSFCTFCAQRNFSIYLLGAREGVAARATEVLLDRHASLRIVGHHHGYFAESLGPEIVSSVNHAQPDILILALASPYQEEWMMKHRNELNVPVIWASGGAINYISGHLPRAPLWMRRLGLEWLGRLLREPRRLWKRYVIGIPMFTVRALCYAVRSRFGAPSI